MGFVGRFSAVAKPLLPLGAVYDRSSANPPSFSLGENGGPFSPSGRSWDSAPPQLFARRSGVFFFPPR